MLKKVVKEEPSDQKILTDEIFLKKSKVKRKRSKAPEKKVSSNKKVKLIEVSQNDEKLNLSSLKFEIHENQNDMLILDSCSSDSIKDSFN